MKTQSIIATALVAMLAFSVSCTDDTFENTPNDQELGIIEFQTREVSIEEAQRDLESLLNDLYKGGLSKSNSHKRVIGEKFTIEPHKGLSKSAGGIDIPLHVFNFENEEGFAIMSGDRETESLLCLSESGNYNPHDSIDNPGFGIFMDCLVGLPYRKPNDPEDPTPKPNDPKPTTPTDDNSIFYKYGPYKNVVVTPQYGLCNVTWGQSGSYNKYCNKYPVGCVAVAVGQIMSTFQYPIQYQDRKFNWVEMIAGHNIDTVAWLLKRLGDSTNLAMTYTTSGSYAPTNNVSRTFRNFGYSCPGTQSDFITSKALEELNQGYPFYMDGASIKTEENGTVKYSNAHAWVVHGYLCRSRIIEKLYIATGKKTTTIENNYYYLMNWGWSGNHDGYYLSDCYDVRYGTKPDFDRSLSKSKTVTGTSYVFKYNFHMVSGIRK